MSASERIQRLLDNGGPSIVFQPVFLMEGIIPVGAEALSRFPEILRQSPYEWFCDAAQVGLQIELELCAIRNALRIYQDIWKARRIQLGVNASPATIIDPRFLASLQQADPKLLVLEITEHDRVSDYERLGMVCAHLRAMGVKIAIDDVGAGYASMSHILALRPDIMKLDISIIRNIDSNSMQYALASALVNFANNFDCKVVGEGVETDGELRCLYKLGIQTVQGFLLSKPRSIDDLKTLLDADDEERRLFLLRR